MKRDAGNGALSVRSDVNSLTTEDNQCQCAILLLCAY